MLMCGLLLAGCGDDEGETPATPENLEQQLAEAREAVAEAEAEAPEPEEVNPCEVLTEELVRANLEVPEGAEVRQSRGSGPASKLCTYSWDNPDFDEAAHRREIMRKMREGMRKGGAVEGIMEAAMGARQSAEVNYTHMPRLESEEAAETRFDGIVQMLERGISSDVEAMGQKQTVTIQSGFDEVEGVGDQAAWSDRLHQLTVRDGTQIFHLSVRVEDEDEANQRLTEELARAIIDS